MFSYSVAYCFLNLFKLIVRLACRSKFTIPASFSGKSPDDEVLGGMFLPPADFYIPSTLDRSLSAIQLSQDLSEDDEMLGKMFMPPREFYLPSSLDSAMSKMSLSKCEVCDVKPVKDSSWRTYLCSQNDLSAPVNNKLIGSRFKRRKP